MKIYFVSSNEFKLKETSEMLTSSKVEVEWFNEKINEIQSEDAEQIVRDKLLKAFKLIRKPLFVEHTGLYLEDFGELPGGLTQIVWDALQPDKFCDFFGNRKNTNAKAVTVLGYCDGKNIKIFRGSIDGSISDKPRGDRAFQWDCVFIPKGYDKTFAELGTVKNNISMRKLAFEEFKKYLEE